MATSLTLSNATSTLSSALGDWARNRAKLDAALLIWMHKLSELGLFTSESKVELESVRERLARTGYTVAIVGEISRGKSELINTLLFGNEGQRMLPAGAGRTTLCPTEFFCDLEQPPFIELLPIETHLIPASLAILKNDITLWERTPINVQDPNDLARSLLHLCESQTVEPEEAQRLGLLQASIETVSTKADNKHWVTIPRWRHARVNIHHPMLANGLVILDTPGLNALGGESELTDDVLPSADAVMCMISAESGLTRSDLNVWRDQLSEIDPAKKYLLINKIDTLFDGLRTPLQIQAQLAQLQAETNRMLAVPPAQSFMISALQALQGQIRHNAEDVKASRLVLLEQALTEQVFATWAQQLSGFVRQRVAAHYQALSELLAGLHAQTQASLDKTVSIDGQSIDAKTLISDGQAAMQAHELESSIFDQARTSMNQITVRMRAYLTIDQFEATILSIDQAGNQTPTDSIKSTVMNLLEQMVSNVAQAQRCGKELRMVLAQLCQSMSLDMSKLNAAQAYALETDSQDWQGDEVIAAIRRLNETADQTINATPVFARFQSSNAATVAKAQVQRALQILKIAQDSGLQWMKAARQPVEQAAVQRLASLLKKAHNLERIAGAISSPIERANRRRKSDH